MLPLLQPGLPGSNNWENVFFGFFEEEKKAKRNAGIFNQRWSKFQTPYFLTIFKTIFNYIYSFQQDLFLSEPSAFLPLKAHVHRRKKMGLKSNWNNPKV